MADRGPREWAPKKKYQRILHQLNSRVFAIFEKIAMVLVDEGLYVGDLRAEEWKGNLLWVLDVRGRVGRLLPEEDTVHVSIGFPLWEEQTGKRGAKHRGFIGIVERDGNDIEEFHIGEESFNVEDRAQVERILEKAEGLVPKVIKVLLEYDWDPNRIRD